MGNQWELYSSHPQFEQARAAIDRAWVEARSIAPEQPSSKRAMLAEKHMYEALQPWRAVGAMDTEPLAQVRWHVREHFGCAGGWL